MALTNNEKRLFLVPLLLGLLLIIVLFYNWYVSSQNRALQVLLHQTNFQIAENQSTLTSLEDLERYETTADRYRLDDWIPLFSNEVAVRLYLHHRLGQGLAAVAAHEIQLRWSPAVQSETPIYSDVILTAAFPSFSAMVQFLEQLENTIPPLMILGARISKNGITINADFTMRFSYRLDHEKI